jgi:hypothetical protein
MRALIHQSGIEKVDGRCYGELLHLLVGLLEILVQGNVPPQNQALGPELKLLERMVFNVNPEV